MQATIKIKLMILTVMAVTGFGVLAVLNMQTERSALQATNMVREEADSMLFVKEQRLILANILNTARVALTVEDPAYLPKPWTDAIFDDFLKLKEARGRLESIAERIGALPEPLAKYEKARVMLDKMLQMELVGALEHHAPRDALDDMMVDAVELGFSMDLYLSDLEAVLAATTTASAAVSEEISGRSARMVIQASIVLSALFSMVAIMLGRSATGPLAQATDALSRLAEENMTVEINSADRGDKIRALAEAVERLNETLSGGGRR